MDIKSFTPSGTSPADVANTLKAQISDCAQVPSLVIVHGNRNALTNANQYFDGVEYPVHGASSCLGAMNEGGQSTNDEFGVSALCIFDEDGDYGTAFEPFGDPFDAAARATTQALEHAMRSGEAPDAIWLSVSPGAEEAALQGIESVVGTDVPILGGSAADNDVSGSWYLMDATSGADNGIVVSVLFPSTGISFAYQNGYSPTQNSGTVTKAVDRKIYEIDNRPATEVFSEWTSGEACSANPSDPENILASATLWPLGRHETVVHGVPYYLLAHPAGANSDGSLDVFASVEQGEVLTQMSGTNASLVDRASRVAQQAHNLVPKGTKAAGALMVYCGGCMLSVQQDLDQVVSGVVDALPETPFLGTFTFGEQGPQVGRGNSHGNLMISCLVFHES